MAAAPLDAHHHPAHHHVAEALLTEGHAACPQAGAVASASQHDAAPAGRTCTERYRFFVGKHLMSNLPATSIIVRPGWLINVLLLLVGLLFIGCVDQAAIDDRECKAKGFNVNAKEYAYCREKLQQLRDEDWDRRQRFRELMSG
jgi:hypothetical protein